MVHRTANGQKQAFVTYDKQMIHLGTHSTGVAKEIKVEAKKKVANERRSYGRVKEELQEWAKEFGRQLEEDTAEVDSSKVKSSKTKDSEDGEKKTPSSSSGSATATMVVSIMVALVALAGGLVTPAMWKHAILTISGHPEGRSMPVPVTREVLEGEKAEESASRTTLQSPAGADLSSEDSSQLFPCTESNLAQFRHERAVPGFHIVCFDGTAASSDNVRVRFYPRGGPSRIKKKKSAQEPDEEEDPATVEVPVSMTWPELQRIFREQLGLPEYSGDREAPQPWTVFSHKGEFLMEAGEEDPQDGSTMDAMMRQGMVLAFEGGQWLWPGVRVGFQRQVELYSIMPQPLPQGTDLTSKNRTVTIETLSLVPLVLSVEGFLSEDECQYIQNKAVDVVEYSQVTLMDKDAGRPASDFRTSKSGFLRARGDDILVDIEYRTASLVRVPRNHQEDVQVLRYGVTEKYNSHHDYFDPSLYQKDEQTLRLTANGRRNRFATVFWYLSNVTEGGETVFPRHNRAPVFDLTDCKKGLKVKPSQGKVIIFYSMTADGKLDKYSMHGACPVQEGIKWAGNKWVWNEPMRFVPA